MTLIEGRVFTPADRTYDEIDELAVVISRPDINHEPPQYHAGLIYRDPEDERLYLLHLGWHHCLTRGTHSELDADAGYIWVVPQHNEALLGNVVAACRDIWASNQSGMVAYGFSSFANFFDKKTGGQILGPSNVGLTCAAFVLAAFKVGSIDLVDFPSWKPRKGDKEWKEWIISKMEEKRVAKEHIKRVKAQKKGFRFRPSDVAVASLTVLPTTMAAAAHTVKKIEALVDEWASKKTI